MFQFLRQPQPLMLGERGIRKAPLELGERVGPGRVVAQVIVRAGEPGPPFGARNVGKSLG
jgi:hypothetical protein